MEQNNIITEELIEGTEMVTKNSKSGKGAAMLIGGVLAIGAVAVVKKVKKVRANRKSKKEATTDEVIDADYEECETEE